MNGHVAAPVGGERTGWGEGGGGGTHDTACMP